MSSRFSHSGRLSRLIPLLNALPNRVIRSKRQPGSTITNLGDPCSYSRQQVISSLSREEISLAAVLSQPRPRQVVPQDNHGVPLTYPVSLTQNFPEQVDQI